MVKQQSQTVLLASNQDGAKQGRRCSHSTWSLDDLWATSPWLFASPVFRAAFWTRGRTNVAGIFRFGEVVRHSGLCEFRSCALCREVSRRELLRKNPISAACTWGSTLLVIIQDSWQ